MEANSNMKLTATQRDVCTMSKHDNYMTIHIIVDQFSNICEWGKILVVEHLKSIRSVLGLTLSSGRRKGATLVLVSAAHTLKNVVYKRK